MTEFQSQGGESARMSDRNGVGKSLPDLAREYPMVTLAAFAGLAFAIGALWKVSSSRQHSSNYDRLVARLGELRDQVPRGWR